MPRGSISSEFLRAELGVTMSIALSQSMRNSHRGNAWYPAAQNGAIRGGGALYHTYSSPLQGYTEEEMVHEAQLRQAYNKKRRQFKQMLATASSGSSTVATKDLLLAAKIAQMDLPQELIKSSTFTAERDHLRGTPRKITWKPFYAAVEYPKLHGAGAFDKADLPVLRRNMPKEMAAAEEAVVSSAVADDVSSRERESARALSTRHATTRRGGGVPRLRALAPCSAPSALSASGAPSPLPHFSFPRPLPALFLSCLPRH